MKLIAFCISYISNCFLFLFLARNFIELREIEQFYVYLDIDCSQVSEFFFSFLNWSVYVSFLVTGPLDVCLFFLLFFLSTGVGTPDGIWFFTAACRPSDTCLGLLMDQLHNFGPYTKTANKKFLK